MPGGVHENKDPMQIFQLKPPEWLPKVHIQADLGFHGFQPPQPHQEEDSLSESNVKNGFVLSTWVSAETYSAKDTITQSLNENAIPELESLMSQIFVRRNENLFGIQPSTFKLPSRVTLNETKRQAWFADLANPDVPLQKLGKSVPHGAKGGDLLDLLQANNVQIPRAIWFLRVFGGNETAGLRNKPNYNPTNYSVEWANVVTGYLKKQLTEIALPSAPRPGFNIKQTFKGVLSDPETRERWISRFSYCLDLLHAFYSEGLVDNRTFLAWIVQQMNVCNLAQTGFVAQLANEYLDGMIVSRALARPFVEACLTRLRELSTAQSKQLLENVEANLKNLLQSILLTLPDAFVSPRLWNTYSGLICEVVGEENIIPDSTAVANSMRSVQESLYYNLSDIKQRCESMLFLNLPPRELAQASWSVLDVQVLNSITPQTDLESINFLLEGPNGKEMSNTSLCERIGILLVWSVTPLQYGEHRRYAVTTLLRQWKDKRDERALRRDPGVDFGGSDEFLQDFLFDWLDSSEVAEDPQNLSAVALLYSELVKQDLFSYSKYTQRLIARGDVGISTTEEIGSRHRKILKWMPLHDVPAAMFQERRVILYGTRCRETPEDLSEREIRKEIRSVIPDLFGGDVTAKFDSINSLLASCPCLLSATRFEQFKTLRHWLLPILRKFVISHSGDVGSNGFVRPYCVTVELMGRVKCYGLMLELTLFILEHSSSTEHVITVLDVLRRHRHIWASMNVTKAITRALFTAHQVYTSRGLHSRTLFVLLLDLDNGRNLEQAERQQLVADIASFSHALYPSNEPPDPVPLVLPEILLLTQENGPEAPSILANSLWYKYRTSPDWAWKVWDNTVASLRQIPAMISDVAGRRACALRYASFLSHVDQHLPDNFDKHVLSWFLGPGKHELPALDSDVWDLLTVVLLDLVLREALTTTTLFQGLVYPAWQAGSVVENQQQLEKLRLYLIAANSLFERLLLQDDGGDVDEGGVVFVDLLDIQRLVTRRETVYRETPFPLLLGNIPTLVSIEGNMNISEDIRTMASSIRLRVCQLDEFRQGVYRDLTEVREAFEKPLKAELVPNALHENLVAALRLIFDDGSASSSDPPTSYWRPLSSLLSPWKRAATAVELQFALRQLGEDLSRDDNVKTTACTSLDQLGNQIFSHSFTTEEADFVAVIAKGAGPGVAGKFLNNGMNHICKTLDSMALPGDLDQVACNMTRAGDILRLVTLIVQPFRESTPPPQLDGEVLEGIIPTLCAKLGELATLFEDDSQELDLAKTSPCVFLLARILQFVLTTTVAWSPQARKSGGDLSGVIVRLMLAHGSGTYVDFTAFSLLYDTLLYVLDEVFEVKVAAPEPFRHYPEMNISDLPTDMPLEFQRRFRTLLPWVAINPSVQNLAQTSRDHSGGLVYYGPVQNRPWEWTEFLGDNVPDHKGGDDEHKAEVKNATSLSFELFGTQATGDFLPQSNKSDRTDDTLRSLRTDLSTESVFKRDWRESRIHFEYTGTDSTNNGIIASLGGGDEEPTAVYPSTPLRLHARTDLLTGSLGVSPASSVRSRVSASSFRSPAQSSSRHIGSGEVIDVDSFSVSTSSGSISRVSKRKAAAMQPIEEDDEIQIIENPAVSSSRGGKKTKVKAPIKARAKKK